MWETSQLRLRAMLAAAALLSSATITNTARAAGDREPFTLVVMDPLAAPLACDCVEGYAQRKYEVLGEFLGKQLDREVRVVFGQSLVTALEREAKGRADLVIGKHSVVLFDAKQLKRKLKPIAALTGADGETTQTGLFVVRKDSPAQSVTDLAGYRIFFGPENCDEKSAAPIRLMKRAGVAAPKKIETVPACSDGAAKLMELGADVRAAAVISSYAKPLLEGCGTVKKGDLRIVGETKPLPFVTAFVDATLPAETQQRVAAALDEVQYEIGLLTALETRDGFVAWEKLQSPANGKVASKKKQP